MEEADNYEPVHTFTRKVVPNQIAAYLIMIALLITFLAAVQPNIDDQPLRIVLTILFILCFLTALASGWVTSRRDPVDPVLSDYRGGRRSQITVALETCLYCDVCHSYVLTTSRHCRMCNRCVDNFDHHCVWINNCVGKNNYNSFMIMIAATLTYIVLFVAAVAVVWRQHMWENYKAAMVASWCHLAVAIPLVLLLSALVGLHIYLIAKGLTTFEFIMKKRSQDEKLHTKNEDLLNKTEEQIVQKDKKIVVVPSQNIIFETQQEDGSSQAVSQKPYQDQSLMKRDTNDKSGTTPVSLDHHDKQLKQFYDRHKSLKLLIGSSVLIQPFKDQKNYRSSRYNNQAQNNHNKRYHSTNPHSMRSNV